MSRAWRWYWLGYALALPHSLVGMLLALVYYRPAAIRWNEGCLEVIATRTLIGGKWVGAQTHGWVIVYRDWDQARDRDLRVHERVHVVQALVLGPLFPLLYGLGWLMEYARERDWRAAYYECWAEKQAYRIQHEYEKGFREDAWGSITRGPTYIAQRIFKEKHTDCPKILWWRTRWAKPIVSPRITEDALKVWCPRCSDSMIISGEEIAARMHRG